MDEVRGSYRRCRSSSSAAIKNQAGPRSQARLRFRPGDARLVDTVHHLGDVLVTHIEQTVPVLEALGRPTAVLCKQFAPVLQRFLLAAELAQDRDVFDIGVNRM